MNNYLVKVIGDTAVASGLDFAFVTYAGNTLESQLIAKLQLQISTMSQRKEQTSCRRVLACERGAKPNLGETRSFRDILISMEELLDFSPARALYRPECRRM